MLTAAPDPVVLAAIASPRRREILRLTWDRERPAGELATAMPDVSWGAVSLQVRALVEAGLLRTRKRGRYRYYQADRQRLGPVAAWLERMWDDALWKLKLAAELEATRRGPKPGRSRRSSPSANRPRAKRSVPERATRNLAKRSSPEPSCARELVRGNAAGTKSPRLRTKRTS